MDVGDARGLTLEEDTDDVEAYGFDVGIFRGQVSFGKGADGPLLAWGDRVERVPVSRSAAQLHFDEDERLGSNVETLELRFSTLLGDGTPEVCLGANVVGWPPGDTMPSFTFQMQRIAELLRHAG